MSLAALTSIHTATIQRVAVTNSDSMGQIREYTTAARGSLPTSSTGRIQDLSGNRRTEFEKKEEQIDAVWYTTTDPQVDERDQLTVSGKVYFVQAGRDFDQLGRLFRIDLKKYRGGYQ